MLARGGRLGVGARAGPVAKFVSRWTSGRTDLVSRLGCPRMRPLKSDLTQPIPRPFSNFATGPHATVLFVIGSELARIAREVLPELPIVFVTPGDPVAAGLVASLAHPGGHTTAMTFEFPELSAKRLELLKALSPRVQRVLVLYDPRDASPRQGVAYAREAASQLGLTLIEREVRDRDDFESGLAALAEADAFLAVPGGFPSAHFAEIVRAANAKRVITFLHSRTEHTMEALASYGAREADIARQAARLVDKILRGERAGDLPVERPTKLEFVINLKTAKALGVEIPPALLARADEVIE